MARVEFVEYKGKRILVLDYSGISDPAAAFPLFEETKRVVAQQPPQSLFTLTNVQGSHFDTDVIKGVRDLVEHNRPYVKAGAVVGLSGLMRVVFTTLLHLTGRNIRAFDSVEAAKDYLAQQA